MAIVLVNQQLVRAIAERRLIQFSYKHTGARVVEPHDYGVHGGIERLLGFQLRGQSRSGAAQGWKWFDVASLADLTLLDDTFPGTRADASQHHAGWDRLFARVS